MKENDEQTRNLVWQLDQDECNKRNHTDGVYVKEDCGQIIVKK